MDIVRNDIINDGDGVLDGLNDGERLRLSREAERELGKRSTYYLARHILGYTKLSQDFHVALCRFYDRHLYDLQLHLHPRKHYKTTLITISGKIRLALLDPNITICIIANTLHNSQTFLKEMKAHFIHNDHFRELYPEHAVDRKREEGTTDRFTTPARTNFTERMETFEAASADRAIVSRHYKLMSFDDFVDDKNTATPELNRKLYENYSTSLSVASLTKEGRPWHHIVGTRWNYDDPYQHILDENAISNYFKTLITQAYWKEQDDNGNSTTPSQKGQLCSILRTYNDMMKEYQSLLHDIVSLQLILPLLLTPEKETPLSSPVTNATMTITSTSKKSGGAGGTPIK
jgi:hypothetical protein